MLKSVMLKRVVGIMLCLAITFSLISVNAKESDVIEIKFSVGDSTLKINGNNVTVKTPYVVEGTTLVPLRVITEAFGAVLSWDEETQGIELTLDDVVIKLNINSNNAYINNQVVKLLQAPVLLEDTTMVPLRFITENFGADVTFDEATNQITVIKSNGSSDTVDFSKILQTTSKEYIGDSFYEWNMKTPKGMKIVERDFSGSFTYFSDDAETKGYRIFIDPAYEGESLETVGSIITKFSDGYTLIEKQKNKDVNSNEYYYIKFKDKEHTYEYKGYFKNKLLYCITSEVDNDLPNEEKQEVSDNLMSFVLKYAKGDVEDLSNVVDGTREFSNKDMNFSINIPADWFDDSNEDQINSFCFSKVIGEKFYGLARVNIYSTETVEGAESLALSDFKLNSDYFNPKRIIESTPVTESTLGSMKSYEYKMVVDYLDHKEEVNDIFFDLGAYTYNLTLYTNLDIDESVKNKDLIKSSVKFDTIDKDKVGKLSRISSEITYRVLNLSSIKLQMEIPDTFQQINGANDFFSYGDNNSCLSVGVLENDYSSSLKKFVEKLNPKDVGKDYKYINSGYFKTNKYEFFFINYTDKNESESKLNYYDYVTVINNKVYLLTFIVHDIVDGQSQSEIIDKVLNSVKPIN